MTKKQSLIGISYVGTHKLVDFNAEYRGFRKMYGSIPRESSLNVWKSFPCCESRRQFYYMLSGDVPLLPKQQEKILAFFAARGADTTLGFDAYQEVTI